MEARIAKKTLADGLSILERIIPTSSSNPALSYLPVILDRDRLTLQGTNKEIDIEVDLPVDADEKGRALVPAQPFFQIVRNAPGEDIELVFGEQLQVISGSYRTQLNTASFEHYPELVFGSPTEEMLPAALLAKVLSHVRYAVSKEEYRAVFRGVQLELSPGHLRAVASDGYRLARSDLPATVNTTRKLVVPARSADEIIRIFKNMRGDVFVEVERGTLTLVGETVRMAVKLMEGEFPDYARVIPQSFVLEATLQASALRESLKRVAVLSDRNHRVDLIFSDGKLEINSEGDYGRGREEIAVEAKGEPQLALTFNARYLLDALGPIEGDVRLSLAGPTSPSLVRAVEDSGYLAVVMPLQV